MARRALLVGIDAYKVFNNLNTCVADATARGAKVVVGGEAPTAARTIAAA